MVNPLSPRSPFVLSLSKDRLRVFSLIEIANPPHRVRGRNDKVSTGETRHHSGVAKPKPFSGLYVGRIPSPTGKGHEPAPVLDTGVRAEPPALPRGRRNRGRSHRCYHRLRNSRLGEEFLLLVGQLPARAAQRADQRIGPNAQF